MLNKRGLNNYIMKLFGLPVLAREDTNFIAVFSGQIIVPRDLAFHTTVFMKIYSLYKTISFLDNIYMI